ncbi:MAG: 3-dehydroquinate synthase [Clostridia bacterium]|nr:3-dehydroquinate synthase [Clostridia bacterium]
MIITETIRVSASGDHNIYIASGLTGSVGEIVRRDVPGAGKVAVITDSTVAELYLEKIRASLVSAGFSVYGFSFSPGENNKNLETLSGVLTFLADCGLTRSDCVLTLGGGIPGDLGGFAAAVYLRGIRFVQVPATVLACVDSSVGGKTAVDLPGFKNLVGAFHQPSAVIIDPDLLETLPENIYNEGCAEIIKYGVIMDEDFFAFLENNSIRDTTGYIIRRCVEMKRDIVNEDERETGIRAILNFGHTVGHAIEICSKFGIPHGSAVAMGMSIVSAGAYRAGLSVTDITNRLLPLLKKNGLPVSCGFGEEELFAAACSDKKRSGDDIKLIVPERLGKCVPVSVPIEKLREVISLGL